MQSKHCLAWCTYLAVVGQLQVRVKDVELRGASAKVGLQDIGKICMKVCTHINAMTTSVLWVHVSPFTCLGNLLGFVVQVGERVAWQVRQWNVSVVEQSLVAP